MTENFTKAASVLLSRRLNNLLRIDENIEIDTSYITCAEYQLFINEKLGSREYLQPEHWKNFRFPSGGAKKPVTGVRGIHAKEFCIWLNQRESSSIYKYRLPNLDEVRNYPLEKSDSGIGYWCQDENLIIEGVDQVKCQMWATTLSDIFHTHLNDIYDLDILFSENIMTFAAKLQSLAKTSQYQGIDDFIRKIYRLSDKKTKNVDLEFFIKQLMNLKKNKNILNINNCTINYDINIKEIIHIHKNAIYETIQLVKTYKLDKLDSRERLNRIELDLLLKQLQELDKEIKYLKLVLSKSNMDMGYGYNNVVFDKMEIELTNPITGKYESIYLPWMTRETHLLIDFEDRDQFEKTIIFVKDKFQSLQKEVLEKRNKFTFLNNELNQDIKLYNYTLSKTNQALKKLEYIKDNHFYLLIISTICIWIEKIDLAEEIFDLYLYSILLKERSELRIPAWESIRIVRENF